MYKLNLKEVTYGLSEALDLVGIDDNKHGKRVAYMAVEVAKKLKWDNILVDKLYSIGMLHDCGVSSTDAHLHLVNELDWCEADNHCKRGATLVSKTTVYKEYSDYIRYHHTHWIDLPVHLDEKTKDIANLIYMTDRIDALRVQLNQDTEKIIEVLKEYSNIRFKTELVEAFLDISKNISFWFFLEDEALVEYCQDWIDTGINEYFSYEKLKEIALMFASVVDAKSTFTSEHSLGVSNLARYISELMNLKTSQSEIIELTGLLHDIGKLKIDDNILNKPKALDSNDRIKMNKHGFDSYVILKHIKGFKEISYLASLHHETLDGKGYPYGLSEKEIPIEARIIAVADIFQALVQDRPYREGLSAEVALNILKQMGNENKLDMNIILIVKNNLMESYQRATICYEE